jgi:hypothetical protein
LLLLLAISIATTAVHYTDNTLNFGKYPQAAGVTAGVVGMTWLLLTPLAILGYRLYTSGRLLLAYAALAAYSFVGVSTPGHYLEAGLSDFPWWRNLSIITDGVTGGAVLGFVLWSLLVAREWAPASSHGGLIES